jgi:uncharacterized membrane protein
VDAFVAVLEVVKATALIFGGMAVVATVFLILEHVREEFEDRPNS